MKLVFVKLTTMRGNIRTPVHVLLNNVCSLEESTSEARPGTILRHTSDFNSSGIWVEETAEQIFARANANDISR
jgi:hypothetical protein